MPIKSLARLQSLGAKPPDPVLAAIDWLATYLEQSWQMQPKYLQIPQVIEILKPLMKVVPCDPLGKQLYRVVGDSKKRTVGDTDSITTKIVTSFTWGKGKSHWDALADQVGASDADYCYVLQPVSTVIEVANMAWALGPVLKYAKRVYPDAKETDYLDEQAPYKWQKEVIGYSKAPIKAKVVLDLTYGN